MSASEEIIETDDSAYNAEASTTSVPKKIAEKLGLLKGDRIQYIVMKSGKIEIRRWAQPKEEKSEPKRGQVEETAPEQKPVEKKPKS